MSITTSIDSQASGTTNRYSGGVLDLFKSYRRRLPTFFAVLGLVLVLTALYTWTRTRTYSSTAGVVVAPRKEEVGSDRSAPMSDPTADASVDTQVEVIRSPALARVVVDQLGLAEQPLYSRLMRNPGLLERLGLAANDGADERLTKDERRTAVLERIERDLDVRRVAQTFVLEITVTTPDPVLTARIANAFANAYVRQSLDVKLHAARNAQQLLSGQLDRARTEVTAAEGAVGRYKIAHNLVSVGGGTVAEQELTNLDVQVAAAKAAEAEARARYSTARQQLAQGSNGEDVGEALGSPVVQELRRQRAEVARRIAENETRYGPRFPAVATAQRELGEIDRQIHSEVERIISGLEAQSEIASRRAGSLASSQQGSQAAVASNNAAAVRLQELELRANAARQLYEQLLNRVREIGTQAATTQADARIATLAATPTAPSSPNVPINMLVGLLLGTAGGVGAVVLRQGLDETLSTLEDVESRLKLPFLASLPTLESSVSKAETTSPIDAVVVHKGSAFTEAFRSLAAVILRSSPTERPVQTVLLTSSIPNEGKTTSAICLARVIAMGGKRVVLVDADLRRPNVAPSLGLTPEIGTQEILNGTATLDQALVSDVQTGLDVLPVAKASKLDSALFEGDRFLKLVEELKARYDVVVLDGSPVLPVVDSRLLAKRMDAVVFLVRWRATPEAAVQMAVHLLASVGASLTGVALSRVDLRALARSGYGDPAKYFKSYESYYHS